MARKLEFHAQVVTPEQELQRLRERAALLSALKGQMGKGSGRVARLGEQVSGCWKAIAYLVNRGVQ